MKNKTEQTEKPTEEKVAQCRGDFAAVAAKAKDMSLLFSLDGKSSRGEYWATFLMLWLPPVLLAGVIMSVLLFVDLQPLMISADFAMPLSLLIQLLPVACFTIATLVMFPVTVRRLRDAKVCTCLAAIMGPAMVLLAVAAISYWWLGCVAILIVLATGILPPQTNADGDQPVGAAVKVKVCFLAAVLFALSAIMSGPMAIGFMIRYKTEGRVQKMKEKQRQEEEEKQRQEMWRKKRQEKWERLQ